MFLPGKKVEEEEEATQQPARNKERKTKKHLWTKNWIRWTKIQAGTKT